MKNTLENFIHYLFFLFLTSNSFKCDINSLSQRRSLYYKLFKAINNKICEESTIGGELNYNNDILDKFDECSKLEAKMELENETYVFEKCQRIHYTNSTRNYILWQTKCHWNLDENEPYYQCLNENILKPNISEILVNNEMDLDIEQNLEMLNCFKMALNVSLNASNDDEVMGDLGYNIFEFSELFKYNKQLLCNKSLRKQSYKRENETQKVDKYFECFNCLSNDCLARINYYNENISLPYYYNTTNDDLFCNYYEYRFHLSVEAITQKCLFNKIKVKDYYSSQLTDKLKKVLECQTESLELSDDEKNRRQQRDNNYLRFIYTNYY